MLEYDEEIHHEVRVKVECLNDADVVDLDLAKRGGLNSKV